MGSIGFPEMVFIFVLALLIFGPKKLPELGRSLGKGMSEFRRASSELRSSFEREMDNIEHETRVEQPPVVSSDAADKDTEKEKDLDLDKDKDKDKDAVQNSGDAYSSDPGGYDYAGQTGDRKD